MRGRDVGILLGGGSRSGGRGAGNTNNNLALLNGLLIAALNGAVLCVFSVKFNKAEPARHAILTSGNVGLLNAELLEELSELSILHGERKVGDKETGLREGGIGVNRAGLTARAAGALRTSSAGTTTRGTTHRRVATIRRIAAIGGGVGTIWLRGELAITRRAGEATRREAALRGALTGRALNASAGNLNIDVAAIELLLVELLDGLVGVLLVLHLNKTLLDQGEVLTRRDSERQKLIQREK